MDPELSQLVISATKPDGKVVRLLASRGATVRRVEEDEGNVDRYIISKRLAVERRTGSSFLRGIQDKTLFTSAIYLREHFRMPVLIVEGDVNYEYTMFNPQAIMGALSSMMLQYGMSVLSTADVDETVDLLLMMTRQEQVGIPEISLIPKRKATDLADMQRRVVEMLPGCGMVVARDLLQHFGSVNRIMNATPAQLRAVRGMGARKVGDLHRVIHAEYESVDTEQHLEEAIATSPALLFRRPVRLLARQHVIFTEEKERHVVDLVFADEAADAIVLVELKRGKLTAGHDAQIRRYLDNAHKSKLLREALAEGVQLRGMLATVEPCDYQSTWPEVETRVVNRKRVIAVLKKLRRRR